MSTVSHPASSLRASGPLAMLVVASLLGAGLLGAGSRGPASAMEAAAAHIVISELITGGAGASDEFIEIYNPTDEALPLEGLELVYASASGLTVSQRAAWEAGAPPLLPGRHLLIANELGIYAGIADATYASGMAATGGSVALRIVGAASPIDAVGWGSAASTWMEGVAAPAPAPAESLERLPGGSSGSTQDTDDNATDFAIRTVPSPENLASPPVPDLGSTGSPGPSVSSAPSPPVTPTPTTAPSPSLDATPSPGASVVPIATARALPDGTVATIEGVALTGSTFTDGGGYVADASGSVAVLLTSGAFERGDLLRVTGELDDRYAQRTLRAVEGDLVRLGTDAEPASVAAATGAINETVEGRLVRIAGTILGAPTALSAGPAFDVDDGSGPVRVLVASATGIDVTGWSSGAAIDVVGVVGQRDATGTGSTGYRVQPRDVADVRSIGSPPGPTPTPEPSQSAGPSPSDTPGGGVISISAARQLAKNARAVVRGVVTLVPGVVDPTSAVLQDGTGAILLRVGEEVGAFVRGTLVEVEGVRSTLSGMETLRVVVAPRTLGASAEPAPRTIRTGDAGEAHEATLVTVRGGLVGSPRRSTAGTVSFEIDDGSGPLRISIGRTTGIGVGNLSAGTWVEVRGPLGQDTTGSQPLRGYRVWPRDAADVRVTASATDPASVSDGSTAGGTAGAAGTGSSGDSMAVASLDAVGSEVDPSLPVGATLVTGPWGELGIGGLLWDGARLLGLDERLGGAVTGLVGEGRPPVAVEIVGLRTIGVEPETGIAVADFRDDPGSLTAAQRAPAAPAATMPTASGGAQWVSLVGKITASGDRIVADGTSVSLDRQCAAEADRPRGVVSVTGIATTKPPRLIVPCGGIALAPTLARGALAADAPRIGRTDATTGAAASGAPRPSDGVVALLLSAAAATLATGAIAARRLARGPDPDDPTSADPADEHDPEAPERASVPALTLVAMPRDRAP